MKFGLLQSAGPHRVSCEREINSFQLAAFDSLTPPNSLCSWHHDLPRLLGLQETGLSKENLSNDEAFPWLEQLDDARLEVHARA